ncbi:MAG: hypothetical protein IKG58_00425 [Bacilli bacterium]|nr:hypothetical protein [Bacilli bacterium]
MSFINNDDKKIIDSTDYVICSRCGEPMKPDARCCLKCGTLNYRNPENSYMKSHLSEKKLDKINRKRFEEEMDNDDSVYVGGQKLKEVKVEDKKPEETKKIISIPSYVILLILLVIGVICYFIFK